MQNDKQALEIEVSISRRWASKNEGQKVHCCKRDLQH